MTGYESKRAAARDKLLDNDDTQVCQDDTLTIAYQSGYYDGKKAAAQEPTKYSFRAHWEADGCIGVVAAIERLDGGVHLLKDTIDAPQPVQEPVAYLCSPDKNGLFGLPTADKACKDCFPVYTTPPQRPWVGLTDEEIDQGLLRTSYAMKTAEAWREGVRWAYHQLKEKNNG